MTLRFRIIAALLQEQPLLVSNRNRLSSNVLLSMNIVPGDFNPDLVQNFHKEPGLNLLMKPIFSIREI